MNKVLITGGTGMVGKQLIELLQTKGYGIHVFSRNASVIKGTISYFQWNPQQGTYDSNALSGVSTIINLAGAGIADKRWSAARKKEILDSRVQCGHLITKALQETPNTVTTIIQASAMGWYGADVEQRQNGFIETDDAPNDFLGNTCKAWEASIDGVKALQKRLVILRIGIVLSQQGGMVKELKKPMSFGLVPIFGNGKQVVSWIHVADLCKMILFGIENNVEGIYNAVSSEPIVQKVLSNQIAKALGKKIRLPFYIPSFLLKIALGEMSIEVLKSTTVNNNKIKKAGFQFEYPAVESIKNL
jgi:uncharacterized protein